jgi:hypothetical protein
MNFPKRKLIFLLAAALLVSCGGQQPPASPTPDIDAILTESVATAAAYFQQTMTAAVPPATNTPLATVTPLASNTPLALASPIASPTQGFFATSIVVLPSVTGTVYTPTTSPSSLAYGCNNLGLVRNIPSETEVQPGERFSMTWQVANTGSCNWLNGYRLVPVSGTSMAQDSVRLPNPPVPPNEWRQITVNLTAPRDTGTYTQNWRLTDGAGNAFGATLAATITVKRPAYP